MAKKIADYRHLHEGPDRPGGIPENKEGPEPGLRGGFYVSVIDGQRYGLLAGPFETHEEALELVAPAYAKACELDRWAFFYRYGTCRVKDEKDRKPGVLNEQLGVAA